MNKTETQRAQEPISQETEYADAQNDSVESMVDRANQLEREGKTDASLDHIYITVDRLLREKKFAHLDSMLKRVVVSTLSVDLMLGMLTATLPAKSHLPSRRQFFEEAKSELEKRQMLDETILAGLEQ